METNEKSPIPSEQLKKWYEVTGPNFNLNDIPRNPSEIRAAFPEPVEPITTVKKSLLSCLKSLIKK